MKFTKKVQLFLHKNYDNIKLMLLLFIGLVTVIILISVAQESHKATIERNNDAIRRSENAERGRQTLKAAIDDLKADNERQTKLITCLLVIHGQEVIISPEDQAACKRSIDEVKLNTPAPQPQATNQGSSSPTVSSQSTGQTISPAPAEQPGIVEQITKPVSDLVKNLLGV